MIRRLLVAVSPLILTCTLYAQVAPEKVPASAAPHMPQKIVPISSVQAAKIDEMLTLIGTKPALLQSVDRMKKQLNWYAVVQSSTLAAVPKAQEGNEHQITAAYVAEMKNIAESELTWEKLRPSIFQYCVQNFTYEQMDEIIAFYKTPAGKAMVEKNLGLNQRIADAFQSLQVHAKPMTDEATKTMKDKVQALYPAAPASSSSPKSEPASPLSANSRPSRSPEPLQ